MTSTICRGCGRADCPAPTARAAYDAAKAALEAAQDEDCRRRGSFADALPVMPLRERYALEDAERDCKAAHAAAWDRYLAERTASPPAMPERLEARMSDEDTEAELGRYAAPGKDMRCAVGGSDAQGWWWCAPNTDGIVEGCPTVDAAKLAADAAEVHLCPIVAALTAQSKTAAAPVQRLGFVYIPHGAIMDRWTPATAGAGFGAEALVAVTPSRSILLVVCKPTISPV